MNISLLQRLVLITIFVFSSFQAHSISLEEFVHDTLLAHPTVRLQLHIYRQDVQEEEIALGYNYPTVDLTASTGVFSDKSPFLLNNTRTNYEASQIELTAIQNLYDGFETKNQLRQTAARTAAAKWQLIDELDNTALLAIKAYINANRQRDLLILAEENMDSHIKLFRDIKERFDSGVGKRSEVEEVEARVASARASLIAAQNNYEDSLTEMQSLLGRYVIAEDLEDVTIPPFLNEYIQDTIDIALYNNPAIKVARYDLEASEAEYDRLVKLHRPKLDLKFSKLNGTNLNGNKGDTDNTSLTLEFSYNIYNGGKDEATQQKQVSLIHEQQAYAQQAQRQAINALRLSWVADKSLAKQTVYLTENEMLNEKVLASYAEEFELGQRSLTDILNVEGALNESKQRLVNAKYDSYIARYRVLEASGLLFKPLLLKVDVKDKNIVILNVDADDLDELPLDADRDIDRELDRTDHCDNTLPAQGVDQYGCKTFITPYFGYKAKNIPPSGEDDFLTFETNQVSKITFSSLLENDIDPDEGDVLTLVEFTQPEHGEIAKSKDNASLIYKPNENFEGEDFFEYSFTDSQGASSNASVFLTVEPERARGKLMINYVYKKDELTPKSKERFDYYMKNINWDDYEKIEVHAYTDFIGDYDDNQRLSMKRAKALKKLLIKNGAESKIIIAYGWGESNPIAKNSTDAGREINRRGELIFTLKPEFRKNNEDNANDVVKNWKVIKYVKFVSNKNIFETNEWLKINKYTQNLIASKANNITIELHAYTQSLSRQHKAKHLAKERLHKVKSSLIKEGFAKESISTYVWDNTNIILDEALNNKDAKDDKSDTVEIRFYYE